MLRRKLNVYCVILWPNSIRDWPRTDFQKCLKINNSFFFQQLRFLWCTVQTLYESERSIYKHSFVPVCERQKGIPTKRLLLEDNYSLLIIFGEYLLSKSVTVVFLLNFLWKSVSYNVRTYIVRDRFLVFYLWSYAIFESLLGSCIVTDRIYSNLWKLRPGLWFEGLTEFAHHMFPDFDDLKCCSF